MSLNLENFAGSTDFPVVDAGEYEVVLSISKKWTLDNSKDYANCDFLIRDDLDQKFPGAHIFDKAWRDKANPLWFDLKKLGTMLVTQKEKPDYKTTFDENDEIIQYLNGACMKITVTKEYDDYSQKEINKVKYLSYKASTAKPYVKAEPAKEPLSLDAAKAVSNKPIIDEDELPF